MEIESKWSVEKGRWDEESNGFVAKRVFMKAIYELAFTYGFATYILNGQIISSSRYLYHK